MAKTERGGTHLWLELSLTNLHLPGFVNWPPKEMASLVAQSKLIGIKMVGTQNHVKNHKGGRHPFMIGIIPCQPSSARVLIVAHLGSLCVTTY